MDKNQTTTTTFASSGNVSQNETTDYHDDDDDELVYTKSMYLFAMKLYCDLRTKKAFHMNYTISWPPPKS